MAAGSRTIPSSRRGATDGSRPEPSTPPSSWDGQIVMLYRAQDRNGTSRLGFANSADGIHFLRSPEPGLSPRPTMKRMAASKIRARRNFEGTYYLDLYRLQQEGCPAVPRHIEVYLGSPGIAEGRDPAGVQRKLERRLDKVRRPLPEKIDGKYWMYCLGTTVGQNGPDGPLLFDDLLHCGTEATRHRCCQAAGPI